MRLSVALCTYNGVPYLEQQLQSIAAQTRLPDELIICDDGSSDGSIDVLDHFARDAVFPVHFHRNPRNLGVAKNFEQAIHLCTGDVILLCDQDDVWLPHKNQRIEAHFQVDRTAGLVFSNADVVNTHGEKLGYSLWQSVRFSSHQQQQMLEGKAIDVLLKHPVVTGAASAFQAQYKSLFTPIPVEWIHDEWIAFIISAVASVKPIQETLIQYRVHPKNQVGAEGISPTERIQATLRTNPQIYRKRSEHFQILYEFVAQKLPQEVEFITLLRQKIQHFQTRGNLPDRSISRVPAVMRELIQGNYSRYSASNLNALRDLLLRH